MSATCKTELICVFSRRHRRLNLTKTMGRLGVGRARGHGPRRRGSCVQPIHLLPGGEKCTKKNTIASDSCSSAGALLRVCSHMLHRIMEHCNMEYCYKRVLSVLVTLTMPILPAAILSSLRIPNHH